MDQRRAALLGISCALVFAGMSAHPARALAQCTTRAQARVVSKSVKLLRECNQRRLRRGPGAACKASASPACAGSLVNDAMRLAYGANDPAAAAVDHKALHDQLRCQQAIGKGVANFIGKKLRLLIDGKASANAEAKARRPIDKIPDRCAVTVAKDASGVVVPDVGRQMDAAVGAVGTAVQAATLADALVTLLETWVDRVGPHPQPLRPNVLFILTDDQRFDTIGLTHSIDGVTPVMPTVVNELVNKGVTFQNGYVTTDLCAPSRSSLLAAKYAHTTGVHDNGGTDGGFVAFHDASTIPVWLKAAGYRTGIYGKYINSYAPYAPYQAPGWDEWHVFVNPAYFNYTLVENGVENSFGSADTDYSTDVLRDKAVKFIHDSAGGPPFFLYFATKAPHAPATPAPRHAGSFSAIPPWRPLNYNEADVSDKPAWVQAIAPWGPIKQANTDDFDRRQLECLQAVDEAVAALIQALRDIGQEQNTMMVFASDNGYSWGSHRWEPKQCPYEECMRVPLVIRYAPLAPLPRTETGFGLNIDHGETIAELAGATPDPGVEGMSLVRLLDGTAPGWRTDFLEEHWNKTQGDETDVGPIPTYAEVRGEQWKYNEYLGDVPELYDELADPFELLNVVTDPANASVVSSMATRLRELRPGWPSSPSGAFLER
ncbi:MAG TPA: sulfatase [Candidatus Binatia bacterium]|nr:sulfatase [Candidatus Binatia bacterium]